MDLTDEPWALIEPLLPVPHRHADGRGRPEVPPRHIFETILWILQTDAPWHDLAGRYPLYQTCHRWFQTWVRAGVLKKFLRALDEDLRSRGQADDTKAFIDGTYAPAKEGLSRSGGAAPAMRRRSWIMALADGAGLPTSNLHWHRGRFAK